MGLAVNNNVTMSSLIIAEGEADEKIEIETDDGVFEFFKVPNPEPGTEYTFPNGDDFTVLVPEVSDS